MRIKYQKAAKRIYISFLFKSRLSCQIFAGAESFLLMWQNIERCFFFCTVCSRRKVFKPGRKVKIPPVSLKTSSYHKTVKVQVIFDLYGLELGWILFGGWLFFIVEDCGETFKVGFKSLEQKALTGIKANLFPGTK